MKHTCKYHPGEDATWYCPVDGVQFCEECVACDDSADGGRARCFLCNKSLEQSSRQMAREPFWRILSHFMQYALTRDMMGITAAVSVLLAVLPANWLGIGGAVLVGIPLGQLGTAIMERTINGGLRAPDYLALKDASLWPRGAQLWLGFAAAAAALGYGYVAQGMLAGTAIAFAAWLVLPALLMRIEIEGNLLVALLAPQRLLSVLMAVGLDYFLAGLFLFGGFTAVAILVSILYDLLPGFLGYPLAGIAVAWFFMTACHLLGYLVCQHREALGYVSPVQDDRAVRQRRARRPEDERRQAVLLREGRYDKVIGAYKMKLEKQGGSLPLNEQYEKLLSALGRREEQLEHGGRYLDLLMKNQQEYRAMEMLKRYREIDGGFRPATAQSTWDVARLLADNGQAKLAVNLLLDLHKRSPTWPGLAEAYLFVARLLKKEFNLDGKAQQYVRFVETRFRDPKSQQLASTCREELFGSAG